MVDAQEAVIVNALVRQFLVAAQEVMGANGINSVLRTSHLERFIGNLPPDDLNPGVKAVEYARMNEAIEAFYGRGARGMLRRIGRASFQYAIREQPALMGLAGAALRLLPQRQRILFVLNNMVGALKKTNAQVDAWVEDKDGSIAFIERTCAICMGRKSIQPTCYLYIGSIGEAVRWASGQDYDIRETHCIAKGDPYCRFEIGEQISM